MTPTRLGLARKTAASARGARMKKDYIRPLDFKHGRIDMNHGAGGRAAAQLIDELFAPPSTTYLRQGNDGRRCRCRSAGRGRW
jgi:hydrogenase expression/formation protein HypE